MYNKFRCIKITAVHTWNVRFVKGALKYDERNYFGIKIVVDNTVSYRADNFTSPIIVTGRECRFTMVGSM